MSHVFLDLDGVLADFVNGAFKLHGKSIPWSDIRWDFDKVLGLTPGEFWNPMGEDFWANLEPTPEFSAVLETVLENFKPEKVFIMSSPCSTAGCLTGKARWVDRHLPGFSRRCFFTNVKEVMAARGRLLIDDSQANCNLWRENGGSAFLFPRPWNSWAEWEPTAVEELKKFIKTYKLGGI